MTEDTMDLSIAIHESGHAVAYYRLFPEGLMFGTSCAKDEELGTAGWSNNGILPEDADAQTRADYDSYLCAGYAAVVVAGYPEDEAVLGCGSDFDSVQGDLAVAKTKALELIRQPENMKVVKRIADELIRRGGLHYDHIMLLVELADGDLAESEYQQILSLRGWHNNDPTLEPEA